MTSLLIPFSFGPSFSNSFSWKNSFCIYRETVLCRDSGGALTFSKNISNSRVLFSSKLNPLFFDYKQRLVCVEESS